MIDLSALQEKLVSKIQALRKLPDRQEAAKEFMKLSNMLSEHLVVFLELLETSKFVGDYMKELSAEVSRERLTNNTEVK